MGLIVHRVWNNCETIKKDETRNFEKHAGFNCHMTQRQSLSCHSPFKGTNPIFLSLFISISFLTLHHTPFFPSPKPHVLFLGAFEKLRKSTIIFVMSLGLSVRPHGISLLPLDGFS